MMNKHSNNQDSIVRLGRVCAVSVETMNIIQEMP